MACSVSLRKYSALARSLGPTIPARARFRRRDERAVLEESLADDTDPTELETGEDLVYRHPRLATGSFRRLRRGQYAVQDEVDLHGLTADEAREGSTGLRSPRRKPQS